VSDYSPAARSAVIGMHFVGGTIILLTAVPQLFMGFKLPKASARWRLWHRATGHVFFIGCVFASLGGLLYIAMFGTVGGVSMDVSFVLYGVALLSSMIVTWYGIRIRRDMQFHKEWAIRTFALAVGSALYRLLISPLFIIAWIDEDLLSEKQQMLWLNIAAWLFFIPNLLVAEYWIRGQKRPTTVNVIDRNGWREVESSELGQEATATSSLI
jgi:hypothetical protein